MEQTDLERLTEIIEEDSDLQTIVSGLINLSEESFEILAPFFLEQLEISLRSPSNRSLIISLGNNLDESELDSVLPFLIGEIFEEIELSEQKRDFLKQIFTKMLDVANEYAGTRDNLLNVPMELCREDAKLPKYAHEGDSGMDLYATEDIEIAPGETKLVQTGIKYDLPKGYEFQIRPKSGLSLKTKLRIANTPATLDSTYRGEIGIIIENVDPPIKDITYRVGDDCLVIESIKYGSPISIGKGEKVAQLVLVKVEQAIPYQVDHIYSDTERGDGGYGSTGK